MYESSLWLLIGSRRSRWSSSNRYSIHVICFLSETQPFGSWYCQRLDLLTSERMSSWKQLLLNGQSWGNTKWNVSHSFVPRSIIKVDNSYNERVHCGSDWSTRRFRGSFPVGHSQSDICQSSRSNLVKRLDYQRRVCESIRKPEMSLGFIPKRSRIASGLPT